MYFLKGTPFVYQGQEIGMTNYFVDSIDEFVDVESKNVTELMKKLHIPKWYIDKSIKNGSRDNSRVPMHWDDSEFAGFSTVQPWLNVNKNKNEINVEASLKDENSILNYYKKLFKVYKEYDLVREGVYKDLLPHHSKIFAYERKKNDELLLVMSNFSKKEINCNLLNKYKEYNKKVLLNNYSEMVEGKLKPYQTILLYLKK
jgi:glycosidase